MQHTSEHTFHIPVMGLAYTIDTPIKVAHLGINSVISIVQDNLVEKMREHYYAYLSEPYQAISVQEPDYRAKRITDYLNLVNRLVNLNLERVKNTSFEAESELSQYFELLPELSPVKMIYKGMILLPKGQQKTELQDRLRKYVVAGSIDVNIMTKLDRNNFDEEGQVIEDGSDAVAALRGYAQSDLTHSSIILSAGMNPRLFSYMERRPEFDADQNGVFKKKIVIKVSDYRSALVQGKMLAKKGLWVSEFRIESGLNCGGHAFATDGFLIGPILEDFKNKRGELTQTLFETYNQALSAKGKSTVEVAPSVKITMQGGIGTYDEDMFLQQHYGIDSTGWGTPFLLVPEATTVDEHTLSLLCNAKEKDVVLSKKSPLGVRFHYLSGTTAEQERLARIEKGKPGSPCTEKFLVNNTEFSKEPICTASRTYQKQKLEQLKLLQLPEAEYNRQVSEVLEKECLCVGLSNSAVKKYKVKPFKKLEGVNICPGPNIAYFNEVVSLRKMIDHIYGRTNIMTNYNRPHMFMKELSLYIAYWAELLTSARDSVDTKSKAYTETFHKNLLEGIAYYQQLSNSMGHEWNSLKRKLEEGLLQAERQLNELKNSLHHTMLASV